MLADDLCLHGIPDYPRPQLQPVLRQVTAAQKYLLTPQFAAAADDLAQDFTQVAKAFPFCRLPYPTVWIELNHMDRPNFAASEIQAPRFQSKPKRIGFLLRATRDDLSAWKMHLFWNFNNVAAHMAHHGASMAIGVDMMKGYPNTPSSTLLNLKDRWSKEIFDVEPIAHPGWLKSSAPVRDMLAQHVNVEQTDYGLPDLRSNTSRRRSRTRLPKA